MLTCQQRKERRTRRLAGHPEVFAKSVIEFEAISGSGHERPLDDGLAAIVRVLCHQRDAIAHFKTALKIKPDLADARSNLKILSAYRPGDTAREIHIDVK